MFTLAKRSITSADLDRGIQLNCTFWRVVKWPTLVVSLGAGPAILSCVAWASASKAASGVSNSRAIWANTLS